MWNNKRSIYASIVVCFIVAVLLLIVVVFGPYLYNLYMTSDRGLIEDPAVIKELGKIFAWAFYPSSVFAAVILYSLLRLLFNIRKGEVFINANIVYFKVIYWCLFAIAIVAFVSGIFYLPFMIVAAAFGFVGVLLRVLKNVMVSAVELRTENDLTI